MSKRNKIYQKIRDYVCGYLGIDHHFFHRKAILKLDYKIEISKKKQNYLINFTKISLISSINQTKLTQIAHG